MQSILYSFPILTKLKYSLRFSKNPRTSNFMKIRPVGAELFHMDGRTDRETGMTKLIVAFRNFVKAPKNRYGELCLLVLATTKRIKTSVYKIKKQNGF